MAPKRARKQSFQPEKRLRSVSTPSSPPPASTAVSPCANSVVSDSISSPVAPNRGQSGWSFLKAIPAAASTREPEETEESVLAAMDETDTVNFDALSSAVYHFFQKFPPLSPPSLLKFAICKRCRGENG